MTRHGWGLHPRTAAQRLALLLCASLAVSMPLGTAIAPAAAAGSTCVDGWQPMAVDTALALGIPSGSASLGGEPAWLVGRRIALATAGRWDGSTWRRVATPWTTDTGLTAVSALSSAVAWTVGFGRSFSPRPISARWDGSAWRAVPVPGLGGTMATLTDVVAIGPNRALVVGLRLVRGRFKPVAMFRALGTWFDESPQVAPEAEGGLTAVTRAPDATFWAVGWTSEDSGAAPWIGYWDGSAWQSTAPAEVGAAHAYLTDIEFLSATEGWAVGYREQAEGGYAPILQRWDGAVWRSRELPWEPTDSVVLTTVTVDSAGAIVVAGNSMTDAGPSAVMAVKEAGTWAVAPPRHDPYPGSWAQNATALGDRAFVIGRFGPHDQAYVGCDSPAPAGPTVNPADSTSPRAPPDADVRYPRSAVGGSANAIAATHLEGFEARDVTESAGLKMKIRTWGSLVADFNNDGWPDVFLNRHALDVPLLRLGGEAGFSQAPGTFQLSDRYRCAAADATGEGELDLFCTVGRRTGTGMGAHEFFVNVGETGGTLAAQDFGLLDITGRGRVAAFVQLEADALPSLFVGNWPARIDGLPTFNRFYRNNGGIGFAPAPELGLDDSSGGQCALAANLDQDADDELLVCSIESTPGLSAGARLYDFDGTRFVDRTVEWGITPLADLDLEVADFNGDSRPDIAQLRSNRLRISLGRAAGGFETAFELTAKKGVAMAVGDINEDGRPDIYVSRQQLGNSAHLMLVNSGDGRSFTNVAIPQPGSGSADDVLALDYDQNGLTDFLTLNGLYSPGPVKLTAFFRTGE